MVRLTSGNQRLILTTTHNWTALNTTRGRVRLSALPVARGEKKQRGAFMDGDRLNRQAGEGRPRDGHIPVSGEVVWQGNDAADAAQVEARGFVGGRPMATHATFPRWARRLPDVVRPRLVRALHPVAGSWLNQVYDC